MFNNQWYNQADSYTYGTYIFNIYKSDTDEVVEKGFTTWYHAQEYIKTMLALGVIKSKNEVYTTKERVGR